MFKIAFNFNNVKTKINVKWRFLKKRKQTISNSWEISQNNGTSCYTKLPSFSTIWNISLFIIVLEVLYSANIYKNKC